MPWTEGTLTPDDVASHLGTIPDTRLEQDVDAARQWVEDRRNMTDPHLLWFDPRIHKGGVLYAALLNKQRSQPQGFPGMDGLGVFPDDTGAAMTQVYRLVGSDPGFA
jgi:hypothetical protein